MRPKKPGAPRGASGMGAFFSLGAPGGRPGSGLAGAAAAAAAAATAAAERAAAAAKAAREKAEAANERAAAAKAAARPATTALDAAAAVAPAEDAGAAAPAEAAQRPAYAPPATDVAQQQEGGSGSGSASPMAAQDAAQQQPAASAVASVPPPGEPFRQAAKPAHGKQLDGLNLPAASAAVGSMPAAAHDVTRAAAGGASAAASKPAGLALRRGDRVTYAGRVHPSLAAAQQRLDQLHAAIQRVESSGNQRARDYLPQLLVRRQVMAAQSQRVPRLQASGAPPVGSKGRVTAVQGDKVRHKGRRGRATDADGAAAPAQACLASCSINVTLCLCTSHYSCPCRQTSPRFCNAGSTWACHSRLLFASACESTTAPPCLPSIHCRSRCSLTSPLPAAPAWRGSRRSAASRAHRTSCRCAQRGHTSPSPAGMVCRQMGWKSACAAMKGAAAYVELAGSLRLCPAGLPPFLPPLSLEFPALTPFPLLSGGGGQGGPCGQLAAGPV